MSFDVFFRILKIAFGSASSVLYDAPSGTWTTASDTKYPRQGTSLVTLQHRILALGGNDANGANIAAVEEYNPDSDTWYSSDILTRAGIYFGNFQVWRLAVN